MSKEPSLKIVLVGNIPEPLRNALLQTTAFTRKDEDIKYLYQKKHSIHTSRISLNLHDSTQVEEDRRESLYPLTRIFLLTFDASNPISFAEIREKYFNEIHTSCDNKIDFATVLLGIRETAKNTDEALLIQPAKFAEEKNIDVFMIRSLNNPTSIREFVDIATIEGLKKQGLDKPEQLVMANQCSKYLAEENFIGSAIVLTQLSEAILNSDNLAYILFLLAKQIPHSTRSDKNIRNTIGLIIANIRNYESPRIWSSQLGELTLFRTNSRYFPTKQLLPDPTPTYHKALSLSKVE